ncbi:MAG: hypothetical protein IIB27_04075 [Chloroflexi bacterium]|nr:hypothetical protein [Chloroflexota bacterium]
MGFTMYIWNAEGLRVACDPADLTVVVGDGQPVTHSVPLLANERYMTITNDGLEIIKMVINGTVVQYSVNGQGGASMPLYGQADYDIGEYLVPGDNTIEITAHGPGDGSARITIHD